MQGFLFTRQTARLCARFMALAPICLIAWMLVLPQYTFIVAHSTRCLLQYVFGAGLVGADVEVGGVLNMGTQLVFVTAAGGRLTMLNVGHLVGNVAPFVALMLATPGVGLRRRAAGIGIGLGVLFVLHGLTIMVRFWEGRSAFSTTVGFVSITMPFLLWIIFFYRDLVPVAPDKQE